ncbi:MAG: DUF1598 domain-containing protein [Planctomycetota bacterium]
MRLFQALFLSAGFGSNRSMRRGIAALGVVALMAPVAVAGEGDGGVGNGELAKAMEVSKLKLEAKAAATTGDFPKAAEILNQAALTAGDRSTADRIDGIRKSLTPAGGGANPTELMNLITLLVEPDSWQRGGGEIPDPQFYSYVNPAGVYMGLGAVTGSLARTLENSQLMTVAELARTANANQDIRATSSLRLVSLPRLESHVQSLLAEGKSIPEDVASLAGLHEIHFLFVFPETHDVVIGGPASDWKIDEHGRTVSVVNNRPTLHFDDLVTLSRTFADGGSGFFMCSIDPKPEQVKAVREYVQNNQLSSANARKFADKLEGVLGMQNVTIQGIPQDSRVAQVIVDADYQMKLVGIGERKGAPGMKSYFELAGRDERRGSSMDALRWWMTVGYESIQMSADQESFEFTGREVQCQAENQIIGQDGSRSGTGKADGANAQFAELFTEHLPELAAQDVVFADLQNVFDLGLATALIHSMNLDDKAGWQSEVLLTESFYVPEKVEVPRELMTAASSRVYRTGEIVVQVAGGVRVDLRDVVQDGDSFEVSPEVVRNAVRANPIGQHGRWWWDAAAR